MKVTIHQPNFFPWLPFFKKMEAADLFIILSHCQYEKGGYQNRFSYRNEWYTMAINHRLTSLHAKKYFYPFSDWYKIRKKLGHKCLEDFNEDIELDLVNTNTAVIRRIARKLGIKTPITMDWDTGLTATDRLIELCCEKNATHYLSGPSGKKYLKEEKFKKAGIILEYFHEKEEDRMAVIDVL